MQLDALAAAGCERVFADKASGALDERPELARAHDHDRPASLVATSRSPATASTCATAPTRRGLDGERFVRVAARTQTENERILSALSNVLADLADEPAYGPTADAEPWPASAPTASDL